MSPHWKWFLPGYVWALPNTLIGVCLTLWHMRDLIWGSDWYDPRTWYNPFRWRDGCLEAAMYSLPGGETILGQTWGWLVLYKHGNRHPGPIAAHERVHVVQSFLFGPLFLVLYPLWFYWLVRLMPRIRPLLNPVVRIQSDYDLYRTIPFESQAYKLEENTSGWGW
jgi:hypothetical protein